MQCQTTLLSSILASFFPEALQGRGCFLPSNALLEEGLWLTTLKRSNNG